MEKVEIRAVIKYQYLKGLKPQEIIDDFNKTLGRSAPSKTTVYDWYNEFKRGRTSTSTIPSSGRPKEAVAPEMIEKIHDMVLKDRRLKVRDIEEACNISHGSVVTILHEHLHMKKLAARWVPRSLTNDQKRNRVTISTESLDMFTRNSAEFLRRFITMDETWIHYYTPESKQQSGQWLEPGESRPKRPKTQQSAGKVMASVFWDAHGIIFVDYLEKGKTITGDYYCTLLDRLAEEIKKKRPHLAKKKVVYHHDNAPAHSSLKSMAKIHDLHFELLAHPPYSPDLAPSDYYLFPNLKRWLQGKRFYTNEEVKWETEAYFGDLDKTYYKKGIEMLKNRWTKCIELKGDYVEE